MVTGEVSYGIVKKQITCSWTRCSAHGPVLLTPEGDLSPADLPLIPGEPVNSPCSGHVCGYLCDGALKGSWVYQSLQQQQSEHIHKDGDL